MQCFGAVHEAVAAHVCYSCYRWQDAKRNFDGTNGLSVQLPDGLRIPAYQPGIMVTPTNLELTSAKAAQLYDPTINAIIAQASKLLSGRADGRSAGVPCNKASTCAALIKPSSDHVSGTSFFCRVM